MKINLNKKLILEAKDGPWDTDMVASANARNLLNASARENFEKNPIQYFTNWYIRGPLSHLSSEAYGKLAELFYKLLKHTESEPITSVTEFRKELSKLDGPWNKEKEALKQGIEKIDHALTNIKNKHFMHWMLNPFIKGELHSKINYNQKENLELELNKYGDGKGTTSNQEAYDKTREIEHKRALDKIAQDKGTGSHHKLEEASNSFIRTVPIQKNIILPSINDMNAYNNQQENELRNNYNELRNIQKIHDRNLSTSAQLGGLVGGIGGAVGGTITANHMVDSGYTDEFEPLAPMIGASLGGLAGGLFAPTYYNSISDDNKKIQNLDNRIKQQIN
jgi:hypothetical protein